MRETYREFKKRIVDETSEALKGRAFFAFNDDQFEDGMKEIGCKSAEEVVSMGFGGFYRKKDRDLITSTFFKHNLEQICRIVSDEQFDYEMFRDEMADHEFGYTEDITDTLDAIGIDLEEVADCKATRSGFIRALKDYDLTPEMLGIHFDEEEERDV